MSWWGLLSTGGLLGACLCAVAAAAQPAPTRRSAPAPAAPQAPSSPVTAAPVQNPGTVAATTADTKGFRSAMFGMTEEAVRAAIAKDFKLSGEQIKAEENYAEQTRVLAIKVPDLLQGGGGANVAYIFGYKSKTLIQVSASWSKGSDEALTPERLFSNANVLRAHFSNAGYRADSVITNVMVSNGLLLFRGSDVADRTTMLVLQGTMTQGENNQQVLAPTALLLFYIADAKNPDVFKLPPGQF